MFLFGQIIIKGDLWANAMMGGNQFFYFRFLKKALFFLNTHIHVLNCQSCGTDGTVSEVPRRGLVCDLSVSEGGSAMHSGAQRGHRAAPNRRHIWLCTTRRNHRLLQELGGRDGDILQLWGRS